MGDFGEGERLLSVSVSVLDFFMCDEAELLINGLAYILT